MNTSHRYFLSTVAILLLLGTVTATAKTYCEVCSLDHECDSNQCINRRCVDSQFEYNVCTRNAHAECSDCVSDADCKLGRCKDNICASSTQAYEQCKTLVSYHYGDLTIVDGVTTNTDMQFDTIRSGYVAASSGSSFRIFGASAVKDENDEEECSQSKQEQHNIIDESVFTNKKSQRVKQADNEMKDAMTITDQDDQDDDVTERNKFVGHNEDEEIDEVDMKGLAAIPDSALHHSYYSEVDLQVDGVAAVVHQDAREEFYDDDARDEIKQAVEEYDREFSFNDRDDKDSIRDAVKIDETDTMTDNVKQDE